MPRPLLILGPTAGGKSELAVRLAEWLRERSGAPCATTTGGGGEIIGADSMQVYRHLDAGTAKPTPAQRRRARHHLIDCVEPTQRFTVSHWLEQADALIERMQGDGVTPIVVGGTNLYIKALLEGMFDGPGKDEALRAELAEVAPQRLHERLKTIDPAAAQRIHPNDQKRLIRAIEVFELTGKPISELQTQWENSPQSAVRGPQSEGESPRSAVRGPQSKQTDDDDTNNNDCGLRTADRGPGNADRGLNPMLIGLHFSAEAINPRINLRVKAMFFPDKVDADIAAEVVPAGESLPDETRRLEAAGLLGEQAREALGYKQVLEHLAGNCTLDEAFERTKILTRRFAKQQRTWLKRFAGVHWIGCDDLDADARYTAAVDAIEAARTND